MARPLHDVVVVEAGHTTATAHAGGLLAGLGATVVKLAGTVDEVLDAGKVTPAGGVPGDAADWPAAAALDAGGHLRDANLPTVRPHPAGAGDDGGLAGWARGGGAWLTGTADGPPLGGPAPVAAAVEGAALALGLVARLAGRALDVDGPPLLGERAAAYGHGRGGRTSVGGACRLLAAADGWVAVNLPRPADRELVPAWLGVPSGDWEHVGRAVAERPAEATVEGAQLLGLPAAVASTPRAAMRDPQASARGQTWPPAPFLLDGVPATPGPTAGAPVTRTRIPAPPEHCLVVDLSSLWAGPLATRFLADAGATVVKVESVHRPDGGRAGPAGFFDRLNHGKRSVALDLESQSDLATLRRLLRAADVVVEASRPRALDNLGLGPAEVLGERDGQVWISVTGHGRTGPRRQWAALGDDAAVAGGLAPRDADTPPVFCADAVADPATGVHAALAALACWLDDGTHHVDLAMREVAASLAPRLPEGVPAAPAAQWDGAGWALFEHAVLAPQLPPPAGVAPELGADTEAVLDELGRRG